MALPGGVTTCTVTYGTALTALGAVSSISATLTMDRSVVWAATGQSINSGNDPVVATSGTALSFAVPHVDQDGFILPGGDAATLWSYTLTGVVTYATGHKQTFRKNFQVFVGETTLDLDTVADDAAVLDAVIVERERVLSVNGDVGHVIVEAGGGDGTVTSVNGDVGPAVVLDATDVGADPAGSAATAQAAAIAAAATDATTKASAAQTAAVTSAATYTDTAVSAEATARATAISTAINNLVASAPGLLDTLDELAAALGDDPNFAATMTTALAGKQPVDADLTAIAALSTTTFGRALLTLADAAAGRTALALGTAATSNTGDFQPVDTDLTAIAALTTTSYGRAFLALADAAAARTALALGTAATVNTGTASGDVPLLGASGILATARLGSGSASSSTYLRGDQTWAAVSGSGILSYKEYDAASQTAVNISPGGVWTDVSAANLTLPDFTAPASGYVLVRLNAQCSLPNAINRWGIKDGSGLVAGSEMGMMLGTAGATLYVRHSAARRVAVTPGATITGWKFACYNAGGQFEFRTGGDCEAIVMEVWPA